MKRAKFLSSALLIGGLYALTPAAFAKTCSVDIEGNDSMQFNKQTIAIAADCKEVKLTLKHTGKLPVAAMGHNWVLTTTADFDAVANAGVSAGQANHYVPKGDARVLAATNLIGGGETTSITFSTSKLKKGGDYTFFCSFPGHWSIMKGKLTFN